MKLTGKNVLITGASAGIGAACAALFAESGANVVLLARRSDKALKIAEEIHQKFAVKTVVFQCDVRNYESLKHTYENLPDEFKPVDILINNAGKALGMDKIQDGLLSDWDEMIDTNVKGLLYISRIILPDMVSRGSGHVINIGSVAGREVYPMGNVYCASKSAVRAISKGMAIDLNGTGVKLTNIDPGLVETEFSEVRFHGDSERAKTVYKGFSPLTGQDIAESALFAATRPAHVCIQDMLVMPADQASTYVISKKL